MISGGFYHRGHVLLPILLKPPGIIVISLGDIPSVEGLVHHIHTQLIANIQCDLRSRIMSDTQCVKSVFFQNPDASVFCIVVLAGTQHTVVMVDATATKQDALTVDPKPLFCVPFQFTDAKRDYPLVGVCFNENFVAKRSMVGAAGLESYNTRINGLCTQCFTRLFSKAVPFAFDGFENKNKTQAKGTLITLCVGLLIPLQHLRLQHM